MKNRIHLSLFAVLATVAMLFSACNNDGSITSPKFDTVEASGSYIYLDTIVAPVDTGYMHCLFSAQWPRGRWFDAAAQREVLRQLYADTTYSSIEEVRADMVSPFRLFDYFDYEPSVYSEIDSLGDHQDTWDVDLYSEQLTVSMHDSVLTATRFADVYMAGAAHDIFAETYAVYDFGQHCLVALADLMDTASIGSKLLFALKENADNADLAAELFDAEKPLPEPATFYIDFDKGDIVVSYPLYEIAPYSAGIPYIRLNGKWLQQQGWLTPYGQRLLGVVD